jgi:hypothetical protein
MTARAFMDVMMISSLVDELDFLEPTEAFQVFREVAVTGDPVQAAGPVLP